MVSHALYGFLFSRDLNNNVAADFPISKAGCVIVESDGLRSDAICRLEKAITFKSAGMLIPKSWQTL